MEGGSRIRRLGRIERGGLVGLVVMGLVVMGQVVMGLVVRWLGMGMGAVGVVV